MKLGACDVVQLDDDQHLLLIVNRELDNRKQRQLTRITQRRLKEVERRNEQLLDSSRDGIAYVQDGMFLYVNDSFADVLGYQDKTDLECLPIMDIIHVDDQQQVKETLKHFTIQQDSENNKNLDLHILLPEGSKKKINIQLFLGEYDDEPCTQFITYKKLGNQEVLEAEIENIKTTDPTTGLQNKSLLIKKIEDAIDAATNKEIPSAAIYIDIDDFVEKVTNLVSMNGADKVLHDIAKIITKNCNDKGSIGRISDHAFAIATKEYDIEKLLNIGDKLCKAIEKHSFEIEKKTIKLTLSIGICLINETITDSKTVIAHASEAIEGLRKNNNGNGVNVYQKK